MGVVLGAGSTVTWCTGEGEASRAAAAALVGDPGSPWLWVAWCFFNSRLSR